MWHAQLQHRRRRGHIEVVTTRTGTLESLCTLKIAPELMSLLQAFQGYPCIMLCSLRLTTLRTSSVTVNAKSTVAILFLM